MTAHPHHLAQLEAPQTHSTVDDARVWVYWAQFGDSTNKSESLRVIIHSDYAQFLWEAVDGFGHKGQWILLLQTNNLCLLYFCDNMVEEGGVYILIANLFLDNFIINFLWSDGATVTREPLQT